MGEVGLVILFFCSDVEERANRGDFARHDKQKHLWLLSEDLPQTYQDQVSCYKSYNVLVVSLPFHFI